MPSRMERLRAGAVVVAAVLAASLLAGTGAAAPLSDRPHEVGGSSVARPSVISSVTITWNGVDIGQASSPSTAFVIGAGQSANVRFNFTETHGNDSVASAELVLLFLGFPLSTESIPTMPPAPAGGWQLNWTFGSLIFLTEGAYEVSAQLLDANGTVLFSAPFYVDARAPYLVGSTIVAMAIVVALAELLWVRTVLSYRKARRGRYRFR